MNRWCVFVFVALLCHPLQAETLPGPAEIKARLGLEPQTIEVAEPHLSTAGHLVLRQYRGWPASAVLDLVLGAAWRAGGVDVEFRALDGYVSLIPGERFSQHSAFLVFEHVGYDAFTVDNPQQNGRNVPLGPYYLVWNNSRDPELLADGATYWPYQVTQIAVSAERRSALLPADLPAELAPTVAVVEKHCLSCHQVNGYGGEKSPGNLALLARAYPRGSFIRWMLEPSSVKPGTTMPGLAVALPEAERQLLAERLEAYLTQVPIVPSTAPPAATSR